MRAFLDDTAQIIGAKFKFDQEVKGRSDREKKIAQFVLDKAKLVYEKAEKIGGVKYLPYFEALLMRRIYMKKYSVNEEGKNKADLSENDSKVLTKYEESLAELLVEYGNKMVACGLVQGTWGNLSVRLDDEYMLVTPSGIDYERLSPKDMVKVKIEDLSYEGNIKPTSEKVLHQAIYKRRKDVGAIVHTHSTYSSVFAAAEKNLILEGGREIKCAKYGIPGTTSLGENTAKAVGEEIGAFMAHHGMVSCGKDLEEAFQNCNFIEDSAKAFLE